MSIRLRVDVDGPARVGQRLEATIVLDADAPRDLRGVTATLKGLSWIQPAEDPRTFLAVTRRLEQEIHVERGQRCFRAVFEIPADAPPSCDGDVSVIYEVHARAEIPWWFDATAMRRAVVLARAPIARPAQQPRTAVSAQRGEGALFLELTLDDTAWAPGEAISGAFSIGNVSAARLDGATVSICATPEAAGVAIPGERSIFKSLVGFEEGGVVRFSLPIPEGTAPSFKSRIGDVQRAVAVRVDRAESECRVPIVIDAFPPRDRSLDLCALVGAERWRAVWRDEGARYGLALWEDALELRGALARGVGVRVFADGNQLAAKLDLEHLGIGLHVQRRGLMMLSGVDMEDVDPAFASRFAARGREDAQVRAVLTAEVCKQLLSFDAVDLRDYGGTLSKAAAARSTGALWGFLHSLSLLAEVLAGAADRVPPPSWVREETIAAWRAFASAASGRFMAGPMKLRDAIADGERIDVAIVPEGGPPEATRVVLHLDPAVDVEEPPAAPPPLVRAARALTGEAAPPPLLDVRPEEMRLQLAATIDDPAALRPLVAEMARLAARLRGEGTRGPYR